MKPYITKTDYSYYKQCPKSFWIHRHKPHLAVSAISQQIIDNVAEIKDTAKKLFGKYIEIPTGISIEKSAKLTFELIYHNESVITNASFIYDNLLAHIDIVENLDNNHLNIYEVCGTAKIEEKHYESIAYKYYVLDLLGYDVDHIYLVYLNNRYLFENELDLEQLFIIEDVTADTKASLETIENIVDDIVFFEDDDVFEDEKNKIGIQCKTDNGYCECFAHCSRHLPSPNIFDLGGRSWAMKKKIKYYDKNIVSLDDLYNNLQKSDEKYRYQIEQEIIEDTAPVIDKAAIREFLDGLSLPLYFLDFETSQFPIPVYDKSYPYQQIPFQYSLHIIDEDGNLTHKEFLADAKAGDPREDLAKQLCEDIPEDVCVLAYHMSFEKNVIDKLSKTYPELSQHLMSIHDNMKDLEHPFSKKWYYTKGFWGSSSIKVVLPTLFPNDDSLDYHKLEGVHRGDEAASAFKEMIALEDEKEIEKIRTNLLKYCCLDTFAMVKVWEKLKEVVAS